MKKIRQTLMLSALCVLLIISQTGCGTKEPVSDQQFCLDTVCTITVYGCGKADAEKIIEEAFDVCRYYENLFSRTIEGSDVNRINEAGGEPVQVSDETVQLIKKGIKFGELSGGKFDITIGAVTSLWDFKSEEPRVPDDGDIQNALKTVDYGQIKIEDNKIALGIEGAQLDLGGIAKGYIADRVAEQMAASGAGQAIINLGGNVVTIGEKEPGTPWVIGVERPFSDRTEIVGAVEAADQTVTTSGVYERCFAYEGELYHHVLDPETGYPMQTENEAVTVMAPSGMSAESDAFGTMFLMLGQDESQKILENYPEIKAAFIGPDDNISAVNGMEILTVE